MRYAISLAALLLISCPRPAVTQVSEIERLREAAYLMQTDPVRAHGLLKSTNWSTKYSAVKDSLLLEIYLGQREYARAAELIDSIGWQNPRPNGRREMVLVKADRWRELTVHAGSELMRGIAYLNLDSLDRAIECLSLVSAPDDFRLLRLARAYVKKEDYEGALSAFFRMGAVPDYLFDEYQETLLDILLGLPDLTSVEQGITRLKDAGLREYVRLRMYEKMDARQELTTTSWKLISNYPRSQGAYHALAFVSPKTKNESRSYGRVLYYNNDYSRAAKHLERGTMDDTAQYLLGRIYYSTGKHEKALNYFERCSWPSAYYYRGRIYEDRDDTGRAIAIYDSLDRLRKGSDYAVRAQKRKAFLLEEIGDTLRAVETFLSIDERNTAFRAAMELLRIGELRRGLAILERHLDPEFIYWRSRTLVRLNEPAESLRQYLSSKFPLSYYSLVHDGRDAFLDTLSLNDWIAQFGDTLLSFTREDSVHMRSAVDFFLLNENDYAEAELKMVKAAGPADLVFLSRLCSAYGADKQSVRYALKVKAPAAERDIYRLPRGLLILQYPVRYSLSIADNYPDLSLCLSMIWQESLFDPGAVSPANAKGLLQIIPSTARTISRALGVEDYSWMDPSTSIRFGTYYLKEMMSEFNSVALALAAYNAGPARVRRWIGYDPNSELEPFIEMIPYDETRNYVKSILGRREIYRYLTGNR